MPPVYVHDPLSAVPGAWRWLDLPVALAEVSSEIWVLALVALALYAWLERRVRDVVEVFAPLVVALVAAAGIAALARLLGAVPRPVDAGEGQLSSSLLRALGSGRAAGVASFAAYSLLAYGRRGRAALLFAGVFAVARVLAGAHWAPDLAMGAALGTGLAALAWSAVARLLPRSRPARLREARRATTVEPVAAPPSA